MFMGNVIDKMVEFGFVVGVVLCCFCEVEGLQDVVWILVVEVLLFVMIVQLYCDQWIGWWCVGGWVQVVVSVQVLYIFFVGK